MNPVLTKAQFYVNIGKKLLQKIAVGFIIVISKQKE